MEKIVKIFLRFVYVQNDQRVMGIILRMYVGVPPSPLPPGRPLRTPHQPPALGPPKVLEHGWVSIFEQAAPLGRQSPIWDQKKEWDNRSTGLL